MNPNQLKYTRKKRKTEKTRQNILSHLLINRYRTDKRAFSSNFLLNRKASPAENRPGFPKKDLNDGQPCRYIRKTRERIEKSMRKRFLTGKTA